MPGQRRPPRRRRPAPTVLLHAGAHKTGTTTVQTMFQLRPDAFPGLYYPEVGRFGHAHHNIAWELIGHDLFDPANGTVADLVADLAARRAERVLVSSEEFEYLYRSPHRLQVLRDSLAAAGYRTQIVLSLRERCSYVESLYAELLKHDYRVPFDDYVDEILQTGGIVFGQWDFRVDYVQLLDGFVAAFGARSVHVLEYRPADSTRAFLDTCNALLGLHLAPVPDWPRYNARADQDVSQLPMRPRPLTGGQQRALRERFGSVTVPRRRAAFGLLAPRRR